MKHQDRVLCSSLDFQTCRFSREKCMNLLAQQSLEQLFREIRREISLDRPSKRVLFWCLCCLLLIAKFVFASKFSTQTNACHKIIRELHMNTTPRHMDERSLFHGGYKNKAPSVATTSTTMVDTIDNTKNCSTRCLLYF